MDKFDFQFHFGYGSFMPVIMFLAGVFTIYLFLNNFMSEGILILLLSLVLYVLNNVFKQALNLENDFNEYLEDFSLFLTFGVTTIIYGIIVYGQNYLFLSIVLFYAICMLLALGRNSILHLKNTCGWPIALNGLFFPIMFYFYEFYLGKQGSSIFIIYYLIIAFLSVSRINFLGKNKDIIYRIKEKNDVQRAENIYDTMLKTDFHEKNLVGEVNDIFNGKKLL